MVQGIDTNEEKIESITPSRITTRNNNNNIEVQSRSRLLQGVRRDHRHKNALATSLDETITNNYDEPQSDSSRRQLENTNTDHDDGNLNLSFEEDEFLTLDFEETTTEDYHQSTSSSNVNPCQSIIAVDGYRLPHPLDSNRHLEEYDTSSSTSTSDGGNNDIIISYEPTHQEAYSSTDEEFICELSTGIDVPIQGTSDQLVELRTLLGNGELISAHSSVAVETITSSNMEMESNGQGQGGLKNNGIVSLPPGNIQLINTNNKGRKLSSNNNENMYLGIKHALLVRVTDSNGLAVKEDAKTISDKFFGTYGDKVNTVSQFDACSFGKLQLTSNYGTDKYDAYMSAPGVVDITIDVALTSSTQADIVSSCKSALSAKMGNLNLPGPFHHIMFIVEDCYKIGTSCNFEAYAYVNHWLSVFRGENYKFPAVVMHEFGHNLNLAHSGGTDGESYTDHTCIMGNPLFEDNVGNICYNPVKNYQIAKNGG